MLKGDELFQLHLGDYKYIFEYDTMEEFKEYLAMTKATHEEIIKAENQYSNTMNMLEKQANKDVGDSIIFRELSFKFVDAKKKAGNVNKSSYKAYASTFNKLIEYFKNRPVNSLELEDYEKFMDFLSDIHKIKNKTINSHINYLNQFLDFAVSRKLIKENNAKGIKNLKEEDVDKENFTDEDIKNILAYEYNEPAIENFFLIAMYSGMRLGEIHNLTNDDIKQDNGIYYFNITDGKTKNSIRQVPIHDEILVKVLEMIFPLLPKKTKDAAQKVLNRRLYKVIDKESTKSFHTFRAKFIEKAMNANPEDNKIILLQDAVGHSKSKEASLTVDGYGKGFTLKLKKEIINSVSYDLEG